MLRFKKIIVLAAVFVMLMETAAFALEGEVIYTDALYGAVVGGLLGTAIYAIDQENPGPKIGGSVVVGTIAGILIGLVETSSSFVEVKNNTVTVGLPTPFIEYTKRGTTYKTSLLKMEF